ncbi:unnamed protein product [Acanthocheilonema viteae]|uniref:Uncharacterized protein n=1 Tax=Acanthocheilonema viteae TaxID=6277 RepID=A0A498SC13_ACAVI|nr:unnamed protein product [Acanthocheilonema viteae]
MPDSMQVHQISQHARLPSLANSAVTIAAAAMQRLSRFTQPLLDAVLVVVAVLLVVSRELHKLRVLSKINPLSASEASLLHGLLVWNMYFESLCIIHLILLGFDLCVSPITLKQLDETPCQGDGLLRCAWGHRPQFRMAARPVRGRRGITAGWFSYI